MDAGTKDCDTGSSRKADSNDLLANDGTFQNICCEPDIGIPNDNDPTTTCLSYYNANKGSQSKDQFCGADKNYDRTTNEGTTDAKTLTFLSGANADEKKSQFKNECCVATTCANPRTNRQCTDVCCTNNVGACNNGTWVTTNTSGSTDGLPNATCSCKPYTCEFPPPLTRNTDCNSNYPECLGTQKPTEVSGTNSGQKEYSLSLPTTNPSYRSNCCLDKECNELTTLLQKCTRAGGSIGTDNKCGCGTSSQTFNPATCACEANSPTVLQCSAHTCTTKTSNDNTLTVDNKGGTYTSGQNAESECCCSSTTPKWDSSSNTCKTTCSLYNNNKGDQNCAIYGAKVNGAKKTKYGGAGGTNIDDTLIDNTSASFGSNCCALPSSIVECQDVESNDPGYIDCSNWGAVKSQVEADDPPTATHCCCPKFYDKWNRKNLWECETTCAVAGSGSPNGLGKNCDTNRVANPSKNSDYLTSTKVDAYDTNCCADTCATHTSGSCNNYSLKKDSIYIPVNDRVILNTIISTETAFSSNCCKTANCWEWVSYNNKTGSPDDLCNANDRIYDSDKAAQAISGGYNFNRHCCKDKPATITSSWYYKQCIISMTSHEYTKCPTTTDWGTLSEKDKREFTTRMTSESGVSNCSVDDNGTPCSSTNTRCCEIPPQQ